MRSLPSQLDIRGAELEEAIREGMFEAYAEAREVSTEHIAAALGGTFPLSRTMDEQITALRQWARVRAQARQLRRTGAAAVAIALRAETASGNAQPVRPWGSTMKILHFHAVAANLRVAPALMAQSGNVLRPFHRFLDQSIRGGQGASVPLPASVGSP